MHCYKWLKELVLLIKRQCLKNHSFGQYPLLISENPENYPENYPENLENPEYLEYTDCGCPYPELICIGRKYTVLVKSFAHLMLWIFCDPPERGQSITHFPCILPISFREARKKILFKCAKLLTKTVFFEVVHILKLSLSWLCVILLMNKGGWAVNLWFSIYLQ